MSSFFWSFSFIHNVRRPTWWSVSSCQKKDKRCLNAYSSWTPGRNNGQPIAPIFPSTPKQSSVLYKEQYPIASDGGIHDEIFRKMVEDRELFLSMCRNMFGSFFVQRMVECSNPEEQEIVMEHLITDMFALCMDKSACRGKYGCRVVQSTIEKLSEDPEKECYNQRLILLQQSMVGITRNCSQLASNEFANYFVQHFVKCNGAMERFRDVIIEQCLLRNLLSMSQEKYASHAVEVAFHCAPHRLAFEMMEVIFEGYIPQPETNRDALDILLFHQYGNYVIQQMINICCTAIMGKSESRLGAKEIEQYTQWLERIKERVARNSHRLERFSSGNKIIEALQASATIGACRWAGANTRRKEAFNDPR
ncbi:hypothetical protein CAEBREN_07483 [Caenorhabditis brenneri]|uniref:PUM-HD domain-containing protein n=1 Tax=Caenorhabditis brenneri TaxID=135651 RepID=G0N2B7_CAEBE|nr:hypothetical protein CAEBREN_07483 [Caenorhabditis brenneri]